MATVTVDQSKLVLNSFAAIFQNNLVSKDLVTWNKFTNEMNDRNGLTVVEQVAPDYTTTFTTSQVNDLSAGVQDTVFGSEQYGLTQVVGSSMGWGDFVKIRDIGEARESEALKAAALRLAMDIDSYIIGYAAKASNNWTGDGTSPISTWDHIASGYTRLMNEGAGDADVRAVLSYADRQALGKDLVLNNGGLNTVAGGVYRSGFEGTVAGVPTLFTQQLPALTVGTRVATATTLTDYATGTPAVSYASVAVSGAPGNFMSSTINIKGQASGVTIVDGEVFTIAGVFAFDARAKKQLPHLQQFRVIGNYTTAALGAATVRYYPAIIVSGPQQTVVNTNGTVNGLAITHLGAAGAALQPRFLANKEAIVVNTADLIMPATGTAQRKSLSQVPMSVRMWQDSSFSTGEHRIRFDVALQANVRAGGRRRVVRING